MKVNELSTSERSVYKKGIDCVFPNLLKIEKNTFKHYKYQMQRPTERKLTPPKSNYNSRKKGEKSFNKKNVILLQKEGWIRPW